MAGDLIQLLVDDIRLGRPVRSIAGVVDDFETAYDIQDRVVPQLGPTCGRKIAMNSTTLMDMAGISEPIVGHIVGEAALADGASVSVSDYAELAIEPEFAAVISVDIPAGTHVEASDLSEVVARFSLAFELLDKRHDAHAMHAPTYVANNVYNAGVVLDETPLDMVALADGAYEAKFTANSEVIVAGKSTAPQNPLEACAFVINHFTARGQDVKAGEVILCGAHHPPMVVAGAGAYVFSLSSGQEVSLSISD